MGPQTTILALHFEEFSAYDVLHGKRHLIVDRLPHGKLNVFTALGGMEQSGLQESTSIITPYNRFEVIISQHANRENPAGLNCQLLCVFEV